MAKVVLKYSDRVIGARVLAKDKPLVMGRGKDVDLVVPNLSVSRRHAKVYQRNGAWYLEDLGSTNGSFSDGERVTVCLLTHGKCVQIGRVQMLFDGQSDGAEKPDKAGAHKIDLNDIFRDEGPTGAIPILLPMDRETETVFVKVTPTGIVSAMHPAAQAGPAPYLEYAGTNPPKRIELAADRLSIGKGDEDEVRVEGMLVSSGHACIERRPDGRWYLVPAKRFPAVTVNGLKITEHCLKFDDYIDLGSTRLWFRKGK